MNHAALIDKMRRFADLDSDQMRFIYEAADALETQDAYAEQRGMAGRALADCLIWVRDNIDDAGIKDEIDEVLRLHDAPMKKSDFLERGACEMCGGLGWFEGVPCSRCTSKHGPPCALCHQVGRHDFKCQNFGGYFPPEMEEGEERADRDAEAAAYCPHGFLVGCRICQR